jgi:hypothetical protein
MSHTLHRQGNREELNRDWVFLAMSAKNINKKGSASRLRRFLELALLHQAVNYGDMLFGNRFDKGQKEILQNIKDESILHAVFSDRERVDAFLRDLKSAELGISIVLSTLLEEGKNCAKKVSLKPHTVSLSLGVWGHTERLPENLVLQITTMCGHGLISPVLIRQMAEDVARGRISIHDAVVTLAKPCVCGVFNPDRASKTLSELAKTRAVSSQKK